MKEQLYLLNLTAAFSITAVTVGLRGVPGIEG